MHPLTRPSVRPIHAQLPGLFLAFLVVFTGVSARVGMPAAGIQAALDSDGAACAFGKHRNGFPELGHPHHEVGARIETAYQQLLHEDPRSEIVDFAVRSNADGPVANATDRAKTYLYISDQHHPPYGYFSWWSKVDGKQVAKRHSAGLMATNAVASLAASGPQAKDFVEAIGKTPMSSGEQQYFDGMLSTTSMMQLGGEFRIWTPK